MAAAHRPEVDRRGGDGLLVLPGMVSSAKTHDNIVLLGPPTTGGSDGTAFVICPEVGFDRSPCGTGLATNPFA